MTFMIPAAMSAGLQIAQGHANAKGMRDQAAGMDQAAADTRRASSADEDVARRGMSMRLGEARAAAAQSGFDASSGSLATLQTKSAAEMELEVLTQRYKGELQAVGLENQARNTRANAKAAKRGGYLNAFATLAGSAGSYMGQPRVGPLAPVETRKWP